MSDYLDLMKQITRAAYPAPEAQADPMEAPWDYLMEYEREPIPQEDEDERSEFFD